MQFVTFLPVIGFGSDMLLANTALLRTEVINAMKVIPHKIQIAAYSLPKIEAGTRSPYLEILNGSRCLTMDQIKFVEDSQSRPYHFKIFKGCLLQIVLGLFFKILTQIKSYFD